MAKIVSDWHLADHFETEAEAEAAAMKHGKALLSDFDYSTPKHRHGRVVRFQRPFGGRRFIGFLADTTAKEA